MALGTLALISGIAAGSSAILGAGQMIAGAKQTRDAEKAARESLRKLSQIETTNKLLALQVPTMGSELRERALARETAGQLEALQEGGAATVIGGAGRLTQAVGEQAAQEAARIDALQAQRDRLVLGQEQQIESAQKDVLRNIQGMRLQGAQAAAQDGRARQQAGAQNIASGIALGAQTFASGLNPYGGEGGEKTTQNMGEQVDIRGSVQDFQKMSGGQPEFRPMYFDSMGRPYNPAYQTLAFGPLSGGMTTPTSLPSNFNYSALGALAG
jgi:hypothetical protein|tara:strand:+ start:2011 stop:2820 length:810 start_codon:yes stop_codon:yes gene_type:complete